MSITEQLRDAGLAVVADGRAEQIGRLIDVPSVEQQITRTGKLSDGAPDVNEVVVPNRGVAYVRRDGEVWLLAVGPVEDGAPAVVWVAAYRDDDVTEEQADAVAAVMAVLDAAYEAAAEATESADGDVESPDDTEDDSADEKSKEEDS